MSCSSGGKPYKIPKLGRSNFEGPMGSIYSYNTSRPSEEDIFFLKKSNHYQSSQLYNFYTPENISLPFPFITRFNNKMQLIFQLPIFGCRIVQMVILDKYQSSEKGELFFGIKYYSAYPQREQLSKYIGGSDLEKMVITGLFFQEQKMVIPLGLADDMTEANEKVYNKIHHEINGNILIVNLSYETVQVESF
ncbi:hypothetical protein ACTA71_009024 [Dictyostelium dimigraforme]